jgi:hypothetical protein
MAGAGFESDTAAHLAGVIERGVELSWKSTGRNHGPGASLARLENRIEVVFEGKMLVRSGIASS